MLQQFMQAAAEVLYQASAASGPIAIRAMTTSTATGTVGAINQPVGTTDGDILVMFISRNSTASTTTTVPANWSTIINVNSPAGAAIFWKVASGEPSSYSVTLGTGVNAATLSLFALQNAQLTTGISIRHQSSTSTTPTASPVTPSADNCILFSMVTVNNSAATTITNVWNSPMIDDIDLNSGGAHTSFQSVSHDIQTTAANVGPSSTLGFTASWDIYYFAIEHA